MCSNGWESIRLNTRGTMDFDHQRYFTFLNTPRVEESVKFYGENFSLVFNMVQHEQAKQIQQTPSNLNP